jgi:hypothetical protein
VCGGMELTHDTALLTEIDQPQPPRETYLAYVFGFIVFLYLMGYKLFLCANNHRWFFF